MKHVYICNIAIKGREAIDVVLSKEKDIKQLFDKTNPQENLKSNLEKLDTSGNVIFIIDVHCTFLGAERMQQQSGVIIYRHLLKQFEKCQDKLKVVFYSPIPKDDLVRLKPENYVLKLLPFVECQYEGVDNFENALEDIFIYYNETGWPQFNNASENLLSGWALVNENQIKAGKDDNAKIRLNKNHKVLFVDDEAIQWKRVYEAIFNKGEFEIAFDAAEHSKYKESLSFVINGSQDEKIKSFVKERWVEPNYLIISDFYLTENHFPESLLSTDELQQKSGSKFFRLIREISPSIPFVFHTTSNKVSYYKYFDQLGVDDWMVKLTSSNTSVIEKITNFQYFQNTITYFFAPKKFVQHNMLRDILNEINEIKGDTELWWKNKEGIIPDRIYAQLYESWFMLRRYINKEKEFEENIMGQQIRRNEYIVPSAVISNLFKIQEYITSKGVKINVKDNNWLDNALVVIRNLASHIRHDTMFHLYDAYIYFKLILLYIKKSEEIGDIVQTSNYRFIVKNELVKGSFNSEIHNSLVICYLTIYMENFLNVANFDEEFIHFFNRSLNEKIYQLNFIGKKGSNQTTKLFLDLNKLKDDINTVISFLSSQINDISSGNSNEIEITHKSTQFSAQSGLKIPEYYLQDIRRLQIGLGLYVERFSKTDNLLGKYFFDDANKKIKLIEIKK